VEIVHQTVCGEECIVCNQRKVAGIHIWGQFICQTCERQIVNTDVTDEKYPFYIERLKRIWLDATS
jgi:hypothetical protein